MFWAGVATALAVLFHHGHKQNQRVLFSTQLILVGIVNGNTVQEKTSEGIKFIYQTEDEIHAIYIKDRQGEGSDST